MSKEISKLMSLVLRHDPGRLGLTLDSNGWTAIDPLVKRIRGAGFPDFDRATLDAVVQSNDKKRFTISEDGQSIRAAQGHSVQIDLGLQPSRPPALLYHGTAVGNRCSRPTLPLPIVSAAGLPLTSGWIEKLCQ